MNAELLYEHTDLKTLLGSIGENHRYIKILLKTKSNNIKEIQSVMDEKARTKTPLNEGQQRVFYEFIGLHAKEGGNLQKSLMRIEYIQNILHNENTQPFKLALLLLQKHQDSAIKSLRRMITSCQQTLNVL
ncbi:MAG: hypothetical protein FWC91_03150 [Defluviitaleaceae bacterium]|nr:hypothetical protein [Defluviitaleaceae bacterium]